MLRVAVSVGHGRMHHLMTDPRFDLGLYALPEAARLVRVPRRTLENWVRGYRYPVSGGVARAKSVITPTSEASRSALSFVNLMEALTLAGFRQIGVPMQRVRKALEYVARQMHTDHLLASERILTDGKELFWEYQQRSAGEVHLVNLSRGGQKAFPEAVMRYLREMEWGRDHFATRWWPGATPGEGVVVVDPRRAFGAPVVAGTGIRTEDVFSRFSAGESLEDLGRDYGLTLDQIQAAVRLEVRLLEPERLAA